MNIVPLNFEEHEIQVIVDTHGNAWWPIHGPCAALGLANATMVLGRLDDDEKKLISIEFSPTGRKKTWCVNEPGLYRLIMQSRKPEAKAFQRWLAHDVLPALRKTGRLHLSQEQLLANMLPAVQAQHGKAVGALQSAFGGRGDCIRWYRQSLQGITGATPKEWRAIGKAEGLAGRICQRGRDVVRQLQPAGACATSLADELVLHHINETEAIAIGKESTTLFQRMLDAGYTPAELHHSPLDGIEGE